MKITGCTIVQGYGPDYCILDTDLPQSTWPYTGNAQLILKVAHGNGHDYIKTHFDLEPKVIKR